MRSAGGVRSWSGFIPRHMLQPAIAPLPAGRLKNPVQPFGFGLAAYRVGAGHHQQRHVLGLASAVEHFGGQAQILDARVGAAADEDHIQRGHPSGTGRAKTDVVEGLFHIRSLHPAQIGGIRNGLVDGDDHTGVGPPGNLRGQIVDGDG
jgi:hypothetical protein